MLLRWCSVAKVVYQSEARHLEELIGEEEEEADATVTMASLMQCLDRIQVRRCTEHAQC